MIPTDQQGNPLAGASPEAADLFDQALRAFNIYRGDPIVMLDRAIETSPGFAMAYIAKAHLYVTSSEPAAITLAGSILEKAAAQKTGARERSHIEALRHALGGEWTRAALALDRHNMQYPRDLLALQSGHLLDFFRGNARNLRDRPARALPSWSEDVPGFPIVIGMYAFGLEECGEYGRAEHEGRRALALEPLDCWAHHAVTHVMEMQGRPEDGIGWMIAREPYWAGDDNVFKVHNWWHRAVFHLELGQADDALALYDDAVREKPGSVVLELVDASALLWRLQLSGIDPGQRWHELAAAWQPHADGRTYAFNDWHAVMAFLGAGRHQEVAAVAAALRDGGALASETGRWARDHGLPLVEGFTAFWHHDYATAATRLFEARGIANAFGGSHAQRDVIDWTLLEACLRGGFRDVATALANERLARKPHSPLNRSLATRATDFARSTPHAA